MKRLLIVAFLSLFAATVFADMTIQKDMAGDYQSIGGATGICTIQYYNMCSGWIWTITGAPGDCVGVAYDLPADCGKLPGEVCENIENRFVCYENQPGRGFTFTVEMYDLDENLCLAGGHGPITVDPANHSWVFTGPLGTTCADRVGITFKWDTNILPRIGAGPAQRLTDPLCAVQVFPPTFLMWTHGVWNSDDIPYCPPNIFTDNDGNINMQMISWFDCQEGTASEDVSWGEVKNLFR